MNWSVIWATVKTVAVAFVGALVPIIAKDGVPTTTGGWVTVALSAGGAAGFYHMPSPSVQPGQPSMLAPSAGPTLVKCIAGLLLLQMTACAGKTAPALEVALTQAEDDARAYASLPRCPVTDGTLCSDPVIVAKIKAADNVAYADVKKAEAGTLSIADAQSAIDLLTGTIPPTK